MSYLGRDMINQFNFIVVYNLNLNSLIEKKIIQNNFRREKKKELNIGTKGKTWKLISNFITSKN